MNVLKKNVIANYTYLIYVTVIGIVVTPMFFNVMGAEAFGLIGFYAVLQTWFVLLDFGLTAALSRECARFKGGAVSAGRLLAVLTGVERVFLCAAAVGTITVIASSSFLANKWLDLQEIDPETVVTCIQMMALAIALRWMASLHRGILNGFERQVWTSNFGIVVATLRFPVCYLVLIYAGATPYAYFAFQLLVALLELIVSMARTRKEVRLACGGAASEPLGEDLKTFVKFSLSISALGIITTLVTQVDKLLLSKILPLKDYGDFYLVTVISGGIILIGGPIASAVIPRLSKLTAESRRYQIHRLYSSAIMVVGAIVFAAGSVMAMFASQILLVWTGDAEFAARMSDVFSMYSMANSIYVVASFAHYLQFAHGNMRIQMAYSVSLLLLLVPATMVSTIKYGALGASFVWLLANIIGSLVLMWAVNAKYMHAPHARWLMAYVFPSLVGSIVVSGILRLSIDWSPNRVFLALQLTGAALVTSFAAVIASRRIRRLVTTKTHDLMAVRRVV